MLDLHCNYKLAFVTVVMMHLRYSYILLGQCCSFG